MSELADGIGRQPLSVAAVSQKSLAETIGDRLEQPLLVAASNLCGALLFAEHGYVLIAGDTAFLDGAAVEGVDRLRAQFERAARRLATRVPPLQDVVREFPSQNVLWESFREVPAGTGTADQLMAMKSFAHDGISAPEFAKAWLAGRRKALRDGERTGKQLSSDMQEIFYAIEDYSFDMSLWEPGNLTDDELRAYVQRVVLRWGD
ncbi:hypothetical protein [Streptomyces buecherae]|uniref:hypothetical protein n=1 Tax=Streptomyces buecherae TaxID=2763006 RepID=UPI00379D71B7